ncbi:MAG: hypothetical protein KDB07_04495, partial [Planctomycetes bacterium]|nr:hypothetical protein [Planctomycetota bacterium]
MGIIDSIRRRSATWRMRRSKRYRGVPPESVKRHSEVAYVLASGPSINLLSNDQLQRIANSDSFGFNFWLLHDLVPRFYLI